MSKAAIGRIVHVIGLKSNGSDRAPAIITRVWSETCINCTVFPDCGETEVKTSVHLYATEEEAVAQYAISKYHVESRGEQAYGVYAYWPKAS